MAQVTRDELRRERLRQYDAALSAARSPIAVLSMFAQGRETRADGMLLEEGFAQASPAGLGEVTPLPAAVWVALRQGDIEATIEALVRLSRTDFVLGVHEEVDAAYRLTTVEERRGLPDVELLSAQLAAFLQIPLDVITIIASWGADDPRTAAEVETLLNQRFGTVVPGAAAPFVPRWQDAEHCEPDGGRTVVEAHVEPDAHVEPEAHVEPAAHAEPDARAEPDAHAEPKPHVERRDGNGLLMSSAEFVALLKLTPEQRTVLATLVRQTTITIRTDRRARPSG